MQRIAISARLLMIICFSITVWSSVWVVAVGQVTESVQAARDVLDSRSDAMVILAILSGLAGIWMWKVVIPERTARKEMDFRSQEARIESDERQQHIAETQAETLAALGHATAAIHINTTSTYGDVAVLVNMTEAQIECLEKLSAVLKCDLSSQLMKMRNLIHDRHT